MLKTDLIKGKRILLQTPDHKSRYNASSWQTKNGNTYTLFRQIIRKAKGSQPDFTSLVLAQLNNNFDTIKEKVVWQPKNESIFLEDPRTLVISNDKVTVGLTAVLRGNHGKYVTFPAITNLRANEWNDQLPAVTIIETFGAGKNTTPLEKDVFMMRQNGENYSHKLLIFSLNELIAKKLQYLTFPKDLPWATQRIGTTMPPIWLTKTKALLIFHGIEVVDGKFVYSLGRALLEKRGGGYKLKISHKKIAHPDDFLDEKGKPIIKELHPNKRRVIYSCGGVANKENDKLSLFVNVGDMVVFKVDYSLSELSRGLI